MHRSTFLRALTAAIASLATPAAAAAPPATAPFRMLVLGDSIAWGQGLEPDHRWRELLVARLTHYLHREVVEIPSEVHSGATIGLGDRNQIAPQADLHVAFDRYDPRYTDANAIDAARTVTRNFELSYLHEGPYAGEVPSYTPTVLRQLDDFDGGPDRDRPVDLILVSASINDVGVSRLLDPVANRAYVREAIEVHCHRHLLALLDRIRARFLESNPNCIVVVLSYYPMIGDKSLAIPPVRDVVRALLASPNRTNAERRSETLERGAAAVTANTSDVAGSAFRSVPRKQSFLARALVAAASRFYALSEPAISAAVADANRAPFSPNFIHVTPDIDPALTVFTVEPNPQLWSLKKDAIAPEDEVAMQRRVLCERLGVERRDLDPSAINACYIASIGHPNIDGAERYADAIWDVLELKLPKS